MPSSIEEFRSLFQRDVPLPCGLTVRIRKISSACFVGLGELPLPTNGQGETNGDGDAPERRETLRSYSDRAIVSGAVMPPFSDRDEHMGSATALHVRELADADYLALSHAIMEWSGLTKEDATNAESFRPDEEREAGAAHG
jgi:hypothetical protein